MQIDFLIGNQIKYSAKIDLKKHELFPNQYQDKKQKFKIPINVNIESTYIKILFLEKSNLQQ
jgi:hypothetical protein